MVERDLLMRFFFPIFFLFPIIVCAQASQVSSLDAYFGEVPLKAGFEKWVEFFSNDQYLGLDSTTERGIFSSIKTGSPNHFPFSNQYPVKFLFDREIIVPASSSGLTVDTAESIMIECVFPRNRIGRKAADSCFRKIVTELKYYYRQSREAAGRIFFYDGVNKDFPELLIESAYSDYLGFYYVLLVFSRSKWNSLSTLKIARIE
jgi:hypothetical protein